MSGVPIWLAMLAALAFLFCTAGWWRIIHKPTDAMRIQELALMMTFGCGLMTAVLVAVSFGARP